MRRRRGKRKGLSKGNAMKEEEDEEEGRRSHRRRDGAAIEAPHE